MCIRFHSVISEYPIFNLCVNWCHDITCNETRLEPSISAHEADTLSSRPLVHSVDFN